MGFSLRPDIGLRVMILLKELPKSTALASPPCLLAIEVVHRRIPLPPTISLSFYCKSNGNDSIDIHPESEGETEIHP